MVIYLAVHCKSDSKRRPKFLQIFKGKKSETAMKGGRNIQ